MTAALATRLGEFAAISLRATPSRSAVVTLAAHRALTSLAPTRTAKPAQHAQAVTTLDRCHGANSDVQHHDEDKGRRDD